MFGFMVNPLFFWDDMYEGSLFLHSFYTIEHDTNVINLNIEV